MSFSTQLERGKQYLQNKQLDDAVTLYEGLVNEDLNVSELVSVFSNLSIVYSMQGKVEKAMENARKTLEFDADHCKAKFLIVKHTKDIDMAIRLYLESRNRLVKKSLEKLFSEANVLLVEQIVEKFGEWIVATVTTKQKLLRIEKKEHHDIWHVEDHFDPSTDEKYVNCPKESFAKENSEELYWKFCIGTPREDGFLNLSFGSALISMLEAKKIPLYFKGEKVISISFLSCSIRGETIAYYGIAKGGAVVRDFDSHFLTKITTTSGSFVIDFMGPLIGNFEFHSSLPFPYKEYKESELPSNDPFQIHSVIPPDQSLVVFHQHRDKFKLCTQGFRFLVRYCQTKNAI